jgi:hypothetical protein
MIFYHRTTAIASEAILKEGFRDGVDYHGWGIVGVWVSNYPLDCNEGAKGDDLLEVDCKLNEAELADYEVIEEGKPYREWIVPAALLNANSTVRVLPVPPK